MALRSVRKSVCEKKLVYKPYCRRVWEIEEQTARTKKGTILEHIGADWRSRKLQVWVLSILGSLNISFSVSIRFELWLQLFSDVVQLFWWILWVAKQFNYLGLDELDDCNAILTWLWLFDVIYITLPCDWSWYCMLVCFDWLLVDEFSGLGI